MQRSAKIPTMGCTWRTAHCWDFLLAAADVCLIVGNFLSEGVRFGSNTKTGGWDILCVFPIRHFDRRVEDDPLSREFSCQKGATNFY